MEELDMEERTNWRIFDKPRHGGRQAGYVRVLLEKRSVVAVCKRHDSCQLLVRKRGSGRDDNFKGLQALLTEAAYKWFAHGRDHDVVAHLAEARRIKESFGMKPR